MMASEVGIGAERVASVGDSGVASDVLTSHNEGKSADGQNIVKEGRDLVAPLCGLKPSNTVSNEKFYISTAITYTNGPSHIGHVYEAITSDVISRYHRIVGRDVFFLTGSDEHGQKVEKTAQSMGITPQQLADKFSTMFQEINNKLNISSDRYIRTTEKQHAETARTLWKRVRDNGDIYLKDYVGWYNINEECYVTDKEAEENNFMDEHGRPLEKKSEESYFFRLSRYQDALLHYFTVENPKFIQPETRRNEMVSFLSEPLQDLCISRTVCQWGLKCPEDPDYNGNKSHVFYVWFDALTNYLTGINYFEEGAETARFWPASVHNLGKDVIRFHAIIWPAMLMSAGIPLPLTVFGHGFVVASDGVKMSKSLGNVMDPKILLDRYPVDSLRYYLVRGCRYGADLAFSEEALCSIHNAILKDGLGNLLHRATSLCQKYSKGAIPFENPHRVDGKLPIDVARIKTIFEIAFSARPELCDRYEYGQDPVVSLLVRDDSDGLQINVAAEVVAEAIGTLNRYLQTMEPWKMKGKDEATESLKKAIVRTVLEGIYIVAHFLSPFVPESMEKVFQKLGVQKTCTSMLSNELINLPPGTSTVVGSILFDELEAGVGKVVRKPGSNVSGSGKEAYEKAVAAKKANKQAVKAKGKGKKEGENKDSQPECSPFSRLEFRVGRIIRVWHHENADRLFCEEIDIGEEQPRKIASGLREHYDLKQLEGRKVVVLCNLKPRKLAGFESNGMVICAVKGDEVQLLDPPAESEVGERLGLDGSDPNEVAPDEPNRVARKKVFEAVAPKLHTNGSGEACYDNVCIVSCKGSLSTSLPDARVS